MGKVNIDFQNPNLIALEMTKLFFEKNPNIFEDDDSNILISGAFLRQYCLFCDCLNSIADKPEIISDKED